MKVKEWLYPSFYCAGIFIFIWVLQSDFNLLKDYQFSIADFACSAFFYFIAQLLFSLSSWFVFTINDSARLPFLIVMKANAIAMVGKYLPGGFWGVGARGVMLTDYIENKYDVAQKTLVEQFLLISTSMLFFIFLILGWVELLISLLVLLFVVLSNISFTYKSFSLSWCARIGTKFSAIVCMILAWVFVGLSLIFLLDLPISLFYLSFPIVSCAANSFFIGFLAIFAPGGIGAREAAGTACLITQGYSGDFALTAMMLHRLVCVVIELLWLFLLLIIYVKNRINKSASCGFK